MRVVSGRPEMRVGALRHYLYERYRIGQVVDLGVDLAEKINEVFEHKQSIGAEKTRQEILHELLDSALYSYWAYWGEE